MGFSLCWLAINGADADEACQRLGLLRTGEHRGSFNTPFFAASLPTGWYLIAGIGGGYGAIRNSNLEQLSRDDDVVFCEVEEHVMYSSAAFWSKGERIWSVIHDSQKGLMHLDAEGELPDNFEAVRRQFLARQEEENKTAGGSVIDENDFMGVDYIFETPLVVAKKLTGYKHDEAADEEPRFETLRRKSWLSRLLAR